MRELNIATVILKKRREKGVTQEALAAHMGVSKASVSKWETGQSYPDVTFLPQLATFFNISIDELMGYSPQMEKEEIKKLYMRLSEDFAKKPFEAVMEECDTIIKKYYSCFPLLTQMATLFLNHHMLTPDKMRQREIIEETIALCQRITAESDDIRIKRQILHTQAFCYQVMQQPQEIITLLGEGTHPMIPDTEMIAGAYFQLGDIKKAKETLQIALYQHLISFVGSTTMYMAFYGDTPEKADTALERALQLCELYKLDALHPNTVLSLYLMGAQMRCGSGDTEGALGFIERYAALVADHFFPYVLHGDDFFDEIEPWFEEFDLGNLAPRNEKIIRESLIESVRDNPLFTSLQGEVRFKNAVKKLQQS